MTGAYVVAAIGWLVTGAVIGLSIRRALRIDQQQHKPRE